MYRNLLSRVQKKVLRSGWMPHYKGYTPFLILGAMRTGSNLLRLTLNSSPQIIIENEVFNQKQPELGFTYDTIMGNLFRKYPIPIKAVGCKIFYNHLSKEEWGKISTLPKFKIIHLRRRNKLRSYLSLKIAEQTNQWIEGQRKIKPPLAKRQILINKQDMFVYFSKMELWERQASERFREREVLNVYYEDLATNFVDTISRVTKFINVTKWNRQYMGIRKQNAEPMEELILNFDEIEEALTNTPFQVYLEEDNV